MSPLRASVVFEDVEWPDRAWFRSNILLDDTGNPAGVDGTSRSLTRGRDRQLLRALRQDAHAIVTGGETVRCEGWHFPPKGYLFVASKRLLPLESCPHIDRLRVFQFSASDHASVAGELRKLTSESNVRHLLCESGPSLLRTLVTAELIDEVFVTIAHAQNSATTKPTDAELTARHALSLRPGAYHLSEIVRETDMTYLRFVHPTPRTNQVFVTA